MNEDSTTDGINFEPLPDRQAGEEDPSRIEDEAELGDLGAAQAKLKKLKEELAKVKLEKQEYLDGWQRCKADSINARKEMMANADRLASRAKEALIEDLIPALDGFDVAAGSPAWESVGTEWRSGIDQIRNQILDVLSRAGVERFGKVGDTFDHTFHDAVEESVETAGESGTITKVLRYGYKINRRVLRPAQVIVTS